MRNFWICILAVFTHSSFAQFEEASAKPNKVSPKQISFHNLNVNNGLSQNSVVSMTQDSIGYLWFATQDGLNKYDGKNFKYYNRQFEDVTKITHSKLGKVYIDKANSMWIITNSGILEKYIPTKDDFELVSNIEAASNVYQEQGLDLFVGTYGNGLHVINHKNKDTLQILKPTDTNKTIYDFLEIKDHIYVTATNSIFKISKKDYTYTSISKNSNQNINYSSITKLSDNSIWVGTYGYGLHYLNSDSNKITQFKGFKNTPLPTNLNIESMLVDKYHRLWVATYGHGIYIINFNKQTVENFRVQDHNPYALHYDDTLCMYQDQTGNIWVGTDGAGLSYYDEHLLKFDVLTNDQLPRNVNIDVARAISVNPSDNQIWVGTSGKGLTTIDLQNKEYKTFSTANSGLNSNRVMSLKFINTDLWIGYQDNGVSLLNEHGIFKHFNANSKVKLEAMAVWDIYQDSNNKIWLGTGGYGLIQFDKNKGVIEKFTNNPYDPNSLSSSNIRVICEGNNDWLYIGTEDNGICAINTITKKIKRINTFKDKIKSLYFNHENDVLWIGTNGNGLKKLNTKTQIIKTYTIDDGLPNNVIYGIIPDENNNLWLSSNRGITMFSDNHNPLLITNYDQYDGLQALEFNTGAYFKDHNNTLYYGGLDGINWFKPEQLTLNQEKPKTIISNLTLFNENISLTPNRVFKYNENTISISFASLHFSQPDLNNYKYKLENHDMDWVDAGNNNLAYYSNLPPNTYTFKVISSNYDGIWNISPASYSFSINKAWYNTTLAWSIYVLLALLSIWSIYYYFKWRWRMQNQLKLEHSETIRLKNLDEFKTKLYTNISHEFRTPLTLILSPVEHQLSNPNINEENKKELSLISQNAKRLLNLVDQLIDLAKLETGHLKLKVEQYDLSILSKQLISAFKYQIQEKEITFKTQIENTSLVWIDKDIIEKIIVNLMANAVKYTPKRGRIFLSITQQNNHAIITIINSGIKIQPEDINKLFTRFYQVNSHADGVGIGLALVKELVSLAKGSLIANIINKDELQFTITLPINKEAFHTEDIIESLSTNSSEIHNNFEREEETNDFNALKTSEKPMVLIVEDNIQLRQYIQSILEPDYKVIKAINGKKGIKKALKTIPDLILSDVMMPEIDGIELCNTLKSNTLTSHIPIILLTAKVGEENELKGLEVGADDFITKPFSSKILVKRIENLISLSKSFQKRYTQFTVLNPKDIAVTSIDETFLSNVEEIMNKHLSDPNFNATVFSKHLLMSRMQLHRKLIALTGLTTSQFICSQRLKLAVVLLQKSDYTVSEIAYQVGFNTSSYFIKCFKEAYHCTPNDYLPVK